jgi:two-component system nitrate/nitrite response regulator NarL
MEPIKVLVVDPHVLFRIGVVSLLRRQTDFEVVGEALDGAQAVEYAQSLEPDIVLMDTQVPGIGALEAAHRIKKILPQVKIVLLTSAEQDEELVQAITAGAQGYLSKRITPEGLCRSLKGVLQGEAALSRCAVARLFQAFAHPKGVNSHEDNPQEEPSRREWEILESLVTGATNKEIATLLGISENTVKSHLRNVMAKLHLGNRVQVVSYALRYRADAEPDRPGG